MSIKYLGIDQALKTTGWALFEEGSLVEHGAFTIDASMPIGERLGQFWKNLSGLLNEYEFEYLFFEDIQRQQNMETYKKLAYVQAAVLMWCHYNSVSCTSLAPSHWRRIIKENYRIEFGRVRAEQKKAAQNFIKEIFNVSATEDECDAICLTLAGLKERNEKTSAF